MDDCGTEEGSTSDAALECPALPPPPSCLTMDAKKIGFLWFFFSEARYSRRRSVLSQRGLECNQSLIVKLVINLVCF
jgi:hypothetical protein